MPMSLILLIMMGTLIACYVIREANQTYVVHAHIIGVSLLSCRTLDRYVRVYGDQLTSSTVNLPYTVVVRPVPKYLDSWLKTCSEDATYEVY